eukprot:TRINITY_DN12292_c0_g1_i1.p1 TRINITY_DN12292_c0_g1~~TRINITY_DN12292_c0_g1_i1.p1  ORF type:complete len:323 (-),score=92.48 TRINITY_DN12292_c0_g1_i1:40-1008(-)
MKQSVVIGVDGGGSKTISVVFDATTKTELGRGISGSTNHNSVGKETAFANLKESIDGAVSKANVEYSQVVGICLGMSGVDRPNDKLMVRQWLVDIFKVKDEKELPSVVYICSDAVIALASGTNGKPEGVVIICGTGMIAYGMNDPSEEKAQRAGGWGNSLDDGSGYCIALAALRAIVRADDLRAPKTSLTELVLNHLNLSKVQDLIPFVYDKDMTWDRMASLLPLVLKAHAEGDSVATKLLEDAAGHLFECIDAVIKKLGYDKNANFTIVLAGGVLTHDKSAVAEMLTKIIKASYPNVQTTTPTISPEAAAALLALNSVQKS